MRRALRASAVNISLPKPDSLQWVTIPVQVLEVDDLGKILSISDEQGIINKRVDQIAGEMVTFTDPVTGDVHTMSAAGVGAGIEVLAVLFMLQTFDAHYDHDLNRVVLNAAE